MKFPTSYYENRKKYIIFNNDCGVSDIVKRGGIYEHYIFDYIRNNLIVLGTTIIDVGANFGFHSLEFADLVGSEGRVISFEPQKIVYYQLCGNIILNGYDNIIPYNLALGNKVESLKMEVPNYFSNEIINIGDVHLNAYNQIRYDWVNVQLLDNFNFDNVSIIKIDVQGYEMFVLEGALSTIEKNKPTIFIEIEESQLNIYNFTKNDIFAKLNDLGYSYKKVLDYEHLVDYVATPVKYE